MQGVQPEVRRGFTHRETNAMSEQQTTDRQLAEWVVQTCLMFGASVVTAYRVAALFIEALEND